ncbi:MAG: LLM class F420-dependent oxidoreductase [Actinomycetota bacterium]|nr:LLM class F420-dependent oxidoreductase [Actinomycetota bacterium]
MKFGIMFASTGAFASAEGATAIATLADATNIESIWSVEHVVIPDGYQSQYPYSESGKIPGADDANIPDPLIWLAYCAAITKHVRLATGILIVPQRNPVVLAKECASLDKLSNGRFDLGIGVGWLEEEFTALGLPFDDRGPRTDDYVAAMRALWTQDKASYNGEFAKFEGAIQRPQPVQDGGVPIVVGGHSKAAARRAGRLGDGFFPISATEDELVGLLDLMKSTAAEHGRDGDRITVTVGSWSPRRDSIDKVKELEQLGIDRLIVAPPTGNLEKLPEAIEQLAEKIAPVATR